MRIPGDSLRTVFVVLSSTGLGRNSADRTRPQREGSTSAAASGAAAASASGPVSAVPDAARSKEGRRMDLARLMMEPQRAGASVLDGVLLPPETMDEDRCMTGIWGRHEQTKTITQTTQPNGQRVAHQRTHSQMRSEQHVTNSDIIH